MAYIKLVLRRFRVLHDVIHSIRLFRPSYRQRHRTLLSQLMKLKSQGCSGLTTPLGDGDRGKAVFLGWSGLEHVIAESVVRKSFELAGFCPHVLVDPTPATRLIYATVGVDFIESFTRYCPLPDRSRATELLADIKNFSELIDLVWDGVTIGKYVSSSLMRQKRQGSLDLNDLTTRKRIIDGLANSISYAIGARRMINELSPTALVQVDRGYSPYGEIFDTCINNGIPVYTWNIAHRDNTLMLKKYHSGNRDAHPSSLSTESWQQLCEAKWGEKQLYELKSELADCYNSGEWYGEVGTQFGKKQFNSREISDRLGLDPSKKTAAIFAHIFWDATFFWGEDLFRDYEDWFVETVRAACANDSLNWLVKIHPANLVKDIRDGISGEHSEISALQKYIGQLPEHVKVIPAETDITTLSLMEVIDYCLTVRGTVGMEAALLGKSVLTAGTGRYDRHGFTVDFDSRSDYLLKLGKLEDLQPPSKESIKLAELYSYGVFICRPVRLYSFDLRFSQDPGATLLATCKVGSSTELSLASELVSIASWLHSGKEDFFVDAAMSSNPK